MLYRKGSIKVQTENLKGCSDGADVMSVVSAISQTRRL